ncbi:hypothetical protein EVAR_10500_1 [Eumeta japonica]|uniref:Uncharacterized protein n=1 Tax=Eumeta variegata TaxID=151549 RepID=A0A4C1TIC3_EUMVA|nr:hypothetical protein EVAR_10500_1 [Eumeta japonica]
MNGTRAPNDLRPTELKKKGLELLLKPLRVDDEKCIYIQEREKNIAVEVPAISPTHNDINRFNIKQGNVEWWDLEKYFVHYGFPSPGQTIVSGLSIIAD